MFKATDLLNKKNFRRQKKGSSYVFFVALFCTQRTMLIGRYQFGAVISPVSPHSFFLKCLCSVVTEKMRRLFKNRWFPKELPWYCSNIGMYMYVYQLSICTWSSYCILCYISLYYIVCITLHDSMSYQCIILYHYIIYYCIDLYCIVWYWITLH